MDVLILISGLLLVTYGANLMTDGAAALAKRLKVSDLVIGLTVVAFGTSAPELVVSVVSALKGSSDLAIGNVVGSNIFNILLIVGFTALVTPIAINRTTLTKEIPLTILSFVVLFVMANDGLFDNIPENFIGRGDSIVLLAFFLIFMFYTFSIAKSSGDSVEEVKGMRIFKAVLFVFFGLAGLIGGGHLFVIGASGIARALGVSEAIIGLTIVSAGTSLPELAASVAAALKKNPELAIGNVVGSCLFNVFFILGCSGTIRPMRVWEITNADFGVMIFSGILLYLFGLLFKKREITRWEGGIMVVCFILYLSYLIVKV